MKWKAVAPDEIPNFRESHRGRVSYPLLKTFLETGLVVAQLDRTGIQQGLQSLNSCLGAYIRSHNLPIRIFNRQGEIYAARTDVDEETGLPNPLYNNIAKVPHSGDIVGKAPVNITDAPVIDAAEVIDRFGVEKNQVTK